MVLLLDLELPLSLSSDGIKDLDVCLCGLFNIMYIINLLVAEVVIQFGLGFLTTGHTIIQLLGCTVEDLLGVLYVFLSQIGLHNTLVSLVGEQLNINSNTLNYHIMTDLLLID